MQRTIFFLIALTLAPLASAADKLPTDEAGAIKYLGDKGCRITLDKQGHAIRLMSQGKAGMTPQEYQLIGLLKKLEQMGLNSAPLKGDEWAFLKSLPALNRLAIWHCKTISDLKPFNGLPVESLTIGGCMGLRDLNKEDPTRHRDAVLTLKNLPQLKKANLYHSPLLPADAHLLHLASEFPQLEELKIDFAAPRGYKTTVTPAGMRALQKLPLRVINMENAGGLSKEHFAELAGVKTLEAVLIDARRKPAPADALAAFKKLRPGVTVVVAGPDAKGPPVRPRVKK